MVVVLLVIILLILGILFTGAMHINEIFMIIAIISGIFYFGSSIDCDISAYKDCGHPVFAGLMEFIDFLNGIIIFISSSLFFEKCISNIISTNPFVVLGNSIILFLVYYFLFLFFMIIINNIKYIFFYWCISSSTYMIFSPICMIFSLGIIVAFGLFLYYCVPPVIPIIFNVIF